MRKEQCQQAQGFRKTQDGAFSLDWGTTSHRTSKVDYTLVLQAALETIRASGESKAMPLKKERMFSPPGKETPRAEHPSARCMGVQGQEQSGWAAR